MAGSCLRSVYSSRRLLTVLFSGKTRRDGSYAGAEGIMCAWGTSMAVGVANNACRARCINMQGLESQKWQGYGVAGVRT